MQDSPAPTIISTNQEPLTLKNIAPAFASSVLPVHSAGGYLMMAEATIKIQRAPLGGNQKRWLARFFIALAMSSIASCIPSP